VTLWNKNLSSAPTDTPILCLMVGGSERLIIACESRDGVWCWWGMGVKVPVSQFWQIKAWCPLDLPMGQNTIEHSPVAVGIVDHLERLMEKEHDKRR
jgi:hypothetical protein